MSAYLQHRCQNDTVGKQPCPCKCSHQHGTGAGDHQRCGEIYQQIYQEMDHQQYQRLFHDGKAVISSGCPDAYRSKFHDHIWYQIIKNSQEYSVQKQCTSLYRKAVIEIPFLGEYRYQKPLTAAKNAVTAATTAPIVRKSLLHRLEYR